MFARYSLIYVCISSHKQVLTTLFVNGNGIRSKGTGKIAETLKGNKVLTALNVSNNAIQAGGIRKLAEALQVNKVLKTLQLEYLRAASFKGARTLAGALRVTHVLTMLGLEGNGLAAGDGCMLEDIGAFLTVSQSLELKLVAVMMAMHLRLGADSGSKALDDSLLKVICDCFYRDSNLGF